MHKHTNLLYRVKETCYSNDISFLRYLFDESYVFKCKKKLTNFQCDDIIDSLEYEFVKEYPRYKSNIILFTLYIISQTVTNERIITIVPQITS